MDKLSYRLPKVAFTGPSGAGKTKLAEHFGRAAGFVAIEGDEMIYKAYSAHPEIAERVFGRAPEAGEDPKEFAFSQYLPLTEEKERACFEFTRDYIEEQLVYVFQNPTTDFGSHEIFHDAVLFQPKDSAGVIKMPNGIAVEMCGFHRAKHLMRRTDFTVLVDSDKEVRKKMLASRPNMQDFIKMGMFDEVVAIREQVQAELLQGAKPNLSLMNNYDDASFKLGEKKIIATMAERDIHI